MLTGDIEHETDGALIAWGDRLQADVLKVAHHGSRTSSTASFLAAVDPKVVVILCGVRNKFRHPSPEVVHRYTESGLAVFRTDHMGAIRLVIDQRALQVRSWLGRANFVLP